MYEGLETVASNHSVDETPVMVATPSAALDLPLKILVAQTETGKTIVFWNNAAWLEQRHGFPKNLIANLDATAALAHAAAG